ncbi:MAG: vitamin K epoxide reductase family protein [Acidobacteria bacterium]|nr:vitamin K epoxide reductase family protein [Acidobacteriota bacterium]MCA1639228.1 vitamin K epoxide reductase family protein [Acidobacteriota bacterium]
MIDSTDVTYRAPAAVAKLPLLAAVVALGGLADAVYLTIKHYTGEAVPCSIVEGCEQVLTSSYAEIFGIPLAMFGAAAYFVAFSLAVLAAFGNRLMWKYFGVQVLLMVLFTTWLVYLQAFVIGAFCQFCLISAALTLTMFIIYLASKFLRPR